MLLPALLALPLTAAALAAAALLLSPRRFHRLVEAASLGAAGLAFLASLRLAARCLREGAVGYGFGDFLRLDALSALLAVVVSGVAFVSLCSGAGYLRRLRDRGHLDDTRLGRYYLLTNLFAFTMLLAVVANSVGVMWVAIEATTITTAFLIGLERSKSALEASWKYILLASIGIALAFVGTVLGYFNFVRRVGETEYALHWTVLTEVAGGLNPDVLRLAFVFLVIGYGTKAGLAPMHTWLPDAHSEAPAPVSSMMSGSLLVVALYAIARWKVVVDACVGAAYSDRMLVVIGTFSVLLAAILLLRQGNYKRLLAYSSVEHVGLISLGLGLGPAGVFAALLHVVGHAAAKSMAFLAAGGILERYGSTRVTAVRGVLAVMPWTGGLFLAGTLALLGLPPFGLFVSELLLFRAGFLAGRPWLTSVVIGLVVLIFVSVLGVVSRMLHGVPAQAIRVGETHPAGVLPLALNVAVLLLLGVVIPGPIVRLLSQAAEIVHP
jgi:hydrogenase-4 component F